MTPEEKAARLARIKELEQKQQPAAPASLQDYEAGVTGGGGSAVAPAAPATPAPTAPVDNSARLDRITELENERAIQDAVNARKGAGSLGGAWSDVNDSARVFAGGALPFGLADRFAAGMNTAIGNVGSSIKIFGEPLMDDPTFGDEYAKERLETDKAAARLDESWGPYASEAVGGAGLVAGPGKWLYKAGALGPLARGAGRVAKTGLKLGGLYAADKFLDEPLAAYGGYKMLSGLLSRAKK